MKSKAFAVLTAVAVMLSANAAFAANVPTPADPLAQPDAQAQAGHPRLATRGNLNVDVGQFIASMLGGVPVEYADLVRDAAASRGAAGGNEVSSYSPSYDSTPVDTSASDAAAEAAAEASEVDLMNSMQAAQEQNDEADAETNAGIAAAVQTEIEANQ